MGVWGRLFGKKPKNPRIEVGRGHRGIAAGDLAERHRRMEAGEQPYSPEEIEAWRTLDVDEVDAFVNLEQPLFVHSSNVSHAVYHPLEQKMTVSFLDGGTYIYSNISQQEALDFAQAQSKGRWVHSVLGHPNTSVGVRKPYTRLA